MHIIHTYDTKKNLDTFLKPCIGGGSCICPINASSSLDHLVLFRRSIATMLARSQNLTGLCLIPAVTGNRASFCVQDPDWKHPFLSLSGNDACESEEFYLGTDYPAGRFRRVLRSEERVSPWRRDKLHQLVLLDLKMPLRGLMDLRDPWELRSYLWPRGGSTSIIGLRCLCSHPDGLWIEAEFHLVSVIVVCEVKQSINGSIAV